MLKKPSHKDRYDMADMCLIKDQTKWKTVLVDTPTGAVVKNKGNFTV